MKTEALNLADLSDSGLFWQIHLPRILEVSRDTTLASLNARAVFRIEGPGGGDWSLVVERGVVQSVQPGALDNATVTVVLSEESFVGIATGRRDHKALFFAGRIQIRGDLPLVLWVANLIPVLREAFPFHPGALRQEVAG